MVVDEVGSSRYSQCVLCLVSRAAHLMHDSSPLLLDLYRTKPAWPQRLDGRDLVAEKRCEQAREGNKISESSAANNFGTLPYDSDTVYMEDPRLVAPTTYSGR